MKLLLVISCWLMMDTSMSYAQKWVAKEYDSFGFSMGLNASFRSLKINHINAESERLYIIRQKSERSRKSFRIGFNYSKGLRNRFLLKSGLRLINPGYNVKDIEGLSPSFSKHSQLQESYSDRSKFSYNYLFLEIPLHLRYIIAAQTCKSFVEFGMAMNYYINTHLKSFRPDNVSFSMTTRENISPIQLSLHLAIGSEWEINELMSGFIQMNLSHQITSIEKNLLVEKFTGLGLEMGCRRIINPK